MEDWRYVRFNPKYEVSSYGRVRRIADGKILRQFNTCDGYLICFLDGVGKRVDYLVADEFIFYDCRQCDVEHMDGLKTNSSANNLRFINRKRRTDIKYYSNFLTDEDRKAGRLEVQKKYGKKVLVEETGMIFPSIKECARQVGGHPSNIRDCCNGRARSHIGLHFKFID